MLTSFHLRTTYGLLQSNLAVGSKRFRAGALAKTTFALHPTSPVTKNASWTGTQERTEKMSCALPYTQRYKDHPGKSVLFLRRAPFLQAHHIDGLQMAVPGHRPRQGI
jgi:hypothetical protein